MLEELFGETPVLPYNREHLAKDLKLTNLSLMERHDMGWLSVFHTLSTENLHKYDFLEANTSNPPGNYIVSKDSTRKGCESPKIGFQKVMKVFNANSAKGYPKKMKRDETTITAFLKRAKAILDKMTPELKEMYLELVNPSKTGQPSKWLCPSPPTLKEKKPIPDIQKSKKSKRTSK